MKHLFQDFIFHLKVSFRNIYPWHISHVNHIVLPAGAFNNNIRIWLEENIKGKYLISIFFPLSDRSPSTIFFSRKTDMMLFKLVWC